MKTFQDKGQTRINLEAITSYSKDFDLSPPNGKVDTIILTIGSAVRKMSYLDTEKRDKDFEELDKHFNVGNQVR